jgi:starch synthase (maltosyl-transferring)
VILVVVNLDPHHAQSGFIDVPLAEWGLDPQTPYLAHELLSDSRYDWQGGRVFVTLAPAQCPACVYRIEPRRSTSERNFDYFV